MSEQYYRIKDIAAIKSGKRLPTGHLFSDAPTNFPYIRSRDIKNGKIQSSNLACLEERTYQLIKKYIIEKGDVAITIVANIGDIGYCDVNCDKFNLTENAVRLTQFKQELVNSKYLAFYLGQPFMKQYMESMAAGAAQAKLGIYKIEKIKVLLPRIDYQLRIASILSAYDNLIENNNKRIRLLEQMAENLYKEWFVRFRFPRHEKVEMENGLPKGWKKEVASKIIDVMSGGTPKTEREDFYGGEIPFYTPKDADDSVFVYSTITNITEEGLAHCNSQYYPENTLMITARGTVGKLCLLAVPMAMNQSCFALSFKDRNNPYYLYYTVKNEVSKLKKMANGGVFDTIIIKTFDHIKIIVPTEDTLILFDKIVSPILDQIKCLQKESISLTRLRDLLLPRLMSGKLEVKE